MNNNEKFFSADLTSYSIYLNNTIKNIWWHSSNPKINYTKNTIDSMKVIMPKYYKICINLKLQVIMNLIYNTLQYLQPAI